MASQTQNHERMLDETEINRLMTRVDDEGAAVERRSRLIGTLSRLLLHLQQADDPRDVDVLEAEMNTIDEILDGRPVA
ncbi:MAG TPA: hypothetical protein VK923_06485 [Euzebyales bacterium]|nr:hypothetical protein [Euzebyales bacterium]